MFERDEKKKKKALYHWSVLRGAILSGQEYVGHDVSQEGAPLKHYNSEYVLKLKHGISRLYDLKIRCFEGSSIKQIIKNTKDDAHLILFDDGNVASLYNDQQQEFFQCREKVLHATYTEKLNQYVVVCEDNHLRIFDRKLSLINSIPYSGEITGIITNPFLNEVITFGKGCFTIWSFRTAGTVLIPRKIVSENLEVLSYILCLCIEETASQRQRCFAAVRSSIFVYLLKLGDCVEVKRKMHDVDIIHIVYFKPLDVLATAGRDGIIKVWSKTWNLTSTFVSHCAAVSSLSVFPFGASLISSSLDNTIRTWSLESNDELCCEREDSPILGICCGSNDKAFMSFTHDSIHKWEVNNIYKPFVMLNCEPFTIKCTSNPLAAVECVTICDDGCIRIICPIKGIIVTTLILPVSTPILKAEYHVAEKILFILLNDSTIVKASTKTNPTTIIKTWDLTDTKAPATICQLSLFEYIAKDIESEDVWSNVVGKAAQQNCIDETFTNKISSNYQTQTTLLIGGCVDGSLVLFDWQNDKQAGKVTFSLKAHHEEITAIAVNPRLSQLASASSEKVVKIWRVFPFAEEAFAPLLLFQNPDIVYLMDFSSHVISAIYQNPNKATHTLSVYTTKQISKANRISHSIFDDHFDEILCIATCPKLRLMATTSVDRTLKIWNTENKLIRILALNDVAHSVSFSSQRGDILLAIRKTIYIINHKSYLPEKYLYQMVAMEFPDEIPIPPIAIHSGIDLSREDKEKIMHGQTDHETLSKIVDVFPDEEQKQRNMENLEKQKSYALLADRDKELNLLKEGKLFAKTRSAAKKAHRDEAFKKYLKLFYRRPSIPYPKDFDDVIDNDDVDDDSFLKKIDDPYKQSSAPQGFFAMNCGKDSLKKIKEDLRNKRLEGLRKRNWDTNDVQPSNDSRSSLKRSFSEETVASRKEPKKNSEHDVISVSTSKDNSNKIGLIEFFAGNEFPECEKTLLNVSRKITQQIDKEENNYDDVKIPIAPDGYLPNSVVVALYKELRRQSTNENAHAWKPRGLTKEQLAEINRLKEKEKADDVDDSSSDFKLPELSENDSLVVSEKVNQVRNEIAKSNISNENLEPDTPPPTPPPKPKTPTTMPPQPKQLVRVVKAVKPIVKLIPEKPITPKKEVQIEEKVVRPPTPLPSYIQQFKDDSAGWFSKLFPNPLKKMFGYGVDGFVTVLLNCISNNNDYTLKTHLISAIRLLFDQSLLVGDILLFIESKLLADLNNRQSIQTPKEINFVLKVFELLFALKPSTQNTIAVLMCQYVIGNNQLRSHLMNLLKELGVQDENEYFKEELNTVFSVLDIEASEVNKKVTDECFHWLGKWIKRLRQHVSSMKGKVCRSQVDKLKKKKEGTGLAKNSSKVKNGDEKTISFVSDDFVNDAANHVTPIDAINYFCECKYHEELEKVRKEQERVAREKREKETKKNDKSKNTVLLLPKVNDFVSLARVGETHQSKCHPERETSLSSGWSLPPIQGKVAMNALLLKMTKLTLNPFPEEMDELLYCPENLSDLITLRSTQKYFVPAKSIVM